MPIETGEPYLYFIYPLYLVALIAISLAFARLGKRKSQFSPFFTPSKSVISLAIFILVYILRVSWVNIREFYSLYTSNTMLAVNDQLVGYMSRTARSFSPMYGVNYFFGHFKPILYLFALFYRVRPGPETLLFMQTLLVGLGAIPVYLLARKKLRDNFCALIFGLAYLFTMTFISCTSFHTTTVSIPFLLWAIYFMEKDNAKMSFLFAALALAGKENISLTILALGFYILIFRRDLKNRKSMGYSLVMFSLVWFYLTLYVIMPIFSRESQTMFLKEVNAIYSYLNPKVLIKMLPSLNRIIYLFFLFLPFGFLPLLSSFSLVALPEIFINIFSSNPAQFRPFNYYSAIILAIFLIASLEAVAKRKWLSLYLLSFVFFTLTFFGPSPEYKIDRHSRIGREFLKTVPEDASIYSQAGLASHLSRREKINIYLADYNYNKNKKFTLKDYDYAILDLKGDKFPDTSLYGDRYFGRLKELIDIEKMGLIKKEDGFILLSRYSPLDNLKTWRGIFIEKEPITSPVIYEGKEIGLVEAVFSPGSKQGGLFSLDMRLVKLKNFTASPIMKIEFKGKRQGFFIKPILGYGLLKPSYWKEGEILSHIQTIRFSPFLWPGLYEIFFSLEDSEGRTEKPAIKIGEVLVKRR